MAKRKKATRKKATMKKKKSKKALRSVPVITGFLAGELNEARPARRKKL